MISRLTAALSSKGQLVRWGFVVSYMGVIYFLSSQPTLPLPSFNLSDKLAHFIAYSLMGLLISEAVSESNPSLKTWEKAVVAVVISSLYGALDEYHQSFVPGRMPSFADFIADTLGACFGAYFWAKVLKSKMPTN